MKIGMVPALALAASVMAACGAAGSRTVTSRTESSTGSGCEGGEGSAVISWIDFVKLNGAMYVADRVAKRTTVGPDELGAPLGEIACKLSDNVGDPDYDIQDGDAGYLDPGTVVYELKDYATWFRVAARSRGELVVYEVDTNPAARNGADLFDIEGRVRAISMNTMRGNGTEELGRIDDPARVRELVAQVLASPVDQERQPSDAEYEDQLLVIFHLADGTTSIRAFSPRSGHLYRGIMTPEEFGRAIDAAVDGKR